MDNVLLTLNYLHQEGSQEYQDRVPAATKLNITDVGNAILTYPAIQNEFITNLINKIALTEVLTSTPDSVFGQFVGQDLVTGDTIESIFVKIAKAKAFEGDALKNDDTLDPFKVTKPEVEVAYHRVDRKTYYTVTVQEANIKNAFRNYGAFGDFVNGIIKSLRDGAEYDLYVDGLELLDRDGTAGKTDIYGKKDALGDYDNAAEMAKAINMAIKNNATYMPFMRTEFNTLGVKTRTPKDNLVVFIRADIKDLIDTELLANVFNPGKLDTGVRVIEIDEFIDGTQVAAILDGGEIKINHSVLQTENARNPRGLYTNYFSHIHRLVSYNPFANAVKITAKLELAE